jgi:hypothetical protein
VRANHLRCSIYGIRIEVGEQKALIDEEVPSPVAHRAQD